MTKNITESTITTKRVLVTPEIAQGMLDKVPEHQRSLSEALVSAYAGEMRLHRWRENAETIKIDEDGNLLDGQHRLSAIVKSGESQYMLIARGVDAAVFGTIDVGRKRTPGDIFGIAGWENPAKAAAITRMINSCEHSHRNGTIGIRKLPPDQFLLYANKHRKEVEIGIDIMNEVRKTMTPAASIGGALAYLHRFAEDAAREFTIQVVEGANLAGDSPALVLRNRLREIEGAGELISAKRIAEIFVMFGAHVRGMRQRKMVPIHQEGNTFVTPVIYISADTAVGVDGRRTGASAAMDQRAKSRAKRGKKKAKA